MIKSDEGSKVQSQNKGIYSGLYIYMYTHTIYNMYYSQLVEYSCFK